MLRLYGIVTAIIGADEVIYNALFLGSHVEPFHTPSWFIIFEIAWAVVSLDVLIRRRPGRAPILPATYILYATAAVFYAWYLGVEHGEVTDAMVPLWWKVLSLLAGLWFVAGGLTLARNR